jgi:dihydroflavonol-4-reductase
MRGTTAPLARQSSHLPDPAFWRDRPVCITGGSGFLGYHLALELLALGARVRLLGLLPTKAHHPLLRQQRLVECLFGDVRDPALVREATAGCDVIFHSAAIVAFTGKALRQMSTVNLDGTRNVLAAAGPGTRVVHISSIVTVGGSRLGESLTEDSPFPSETLAIAYVRSKRAAEELALEASGRRDVVVTNPGFLVGPHDYGPTDMGRYCLRFWKGRLPLALPGGLCLADVRDVACGQLLAAERGKSGRRYLLGGANWTFPQLMRALAQAAGLRPPSVARLPAWLLTPLAVGATGLAWLLGGPPYPSLQHARLSRYYWYARWDRAVAELGYHPRPLAVSLADSYQWFCSRKNMRPRGIFKRWVCPVPPVAGGSRVIEAQLEREEARSERETMKCASGSTSSP